MWWDVVKPEATITLSFVGFVLFLAIVGNYRGWYIPGPTHRREIAAMQERVDQAVKDRDDQVKAMREDIAQRMENFRADHAVRTAEAREDHAAQLEALVKVADGIRSDFAAVLASKDRDIDQWRGAWQITDQAGREEIGAQMDEILAGFRAMKRFFDAFQNQTGVPQLPPSGAEDRHV